jgi:hypothetical protein
LSPGEDDDSGQGPSPQPRSLCPHCGAVCEPYQEYCLACGERLVEVDYGSLAGWLRNSRPFSGRLWVWPVLACFAVAVLASAFAILAVRGNGTNTLRALGPTIRQTMLTSATQTARSTTSSRNANTPPHTGTTRTTGATGSSTIKPSPPPIHSNGLIAWPGPPAYTIVLASIPVSSGKSGAREKALEALNAGLGDVGVLKSSDFSSLHPGYFVVFTGVYKSQSAAAKHLGAARKAGFDSPYAKRVAS